MKNEDRRTRVYDETSDDEGKDYRQEAEDEQEEIFVDDGIYVDQNNQAVGQENNENESQDIPENNEENGSDTPEENDYIEGEADADADPEVDVDIDGQDQDQDQPVEMEDNDDDEGIKGCSNSRLSRSAREGMKKAKSAVDEGQAQLLALKLKELELEAELIQQKTHPEYHAQLARIKDRKERNLTRILEKKKFYCENILKTLDAETQAANETIENSIRALKNQFISSITHKLCSKKKSFDNPYSLESDFITRTKLIYEDKRAWMDDCLEGMVDDLDTPSWAIQVVKKRRRAGYENLWTPRPCLGLNENEKQQDMDLLKMALKMGKI